MAKKPTTKKPNTEPVQFQAVNKYFAARGFKKKNIICDLLHQYSNKILKEDCAKKEFTIQSETPCANQSGGCKTVKLPQFKPCFELHWGDGPNDHIETDDVEILCITACNPYSNVTFKDLVLFLIVTDSAGNLVQDLPDGTPSVEIKPNLEICFGDLPPCNPKGKPGHNCISREVVSITRGALAGDYFINLYYCSKISREVFGYDRISFELVMS